MKIVAILLFFAFVSVRSFPADISESDESSDRSDERPGFYIPTIRRQHQFGSFNPAVVEVDVGPESDGDDDDTTFFSQFFKPVFVNPFAGFRFPDFFSQPNNWFDSITPKVGSDAEVKNATSTTKVVNGHKVVVNDTTYEDEKTGAVFKFHSIQIFPVDSKEETDGKEDTENKETADRINPETSTETVNKVSTEEPETENKNASPEETSSKPDNNSADNEINREELGETQPEQKSQENASSPVEVFEVLEEHEEPQRYTDLSGDIKVNQLMADQGQQLIMIPEDVELLPESFQVESQRLILPNSENQEPQIPISEFSSWQRTDDASN